MWFVCGVCAERVAECGAVAVLLCGFASGGAMSNRPRLNVDADLNRLCGLVAELGPDRQRNSAQMGFDVTQLDNFIRRHGGERYRDAVDGYQRRMRAQHEVAPVTTRSFMDTFDLPPRPFAVDVPRPKASRTSKKWTTALVYGDTHFPYHDPLALGVLESLAVDVQPDVLLNVGDLVDCWQISRWDKNPARLDTLQDNIDAARTHLARMAHLLPNARRVLLEGNHEDRLGKAIWKMEGAARELARLRVFQSSMTWPNLLQTDSIGWDFISTREQPRTAVLPKIITKHGTVVRKRSGLSAYGEWEKYGRSGVSGHTHRLGDFLHRDHNGTARWVETGCTCLLDAPYGSDFDWQQGAVVLTWSADQFIQHVELVSIRDGRAIWRDKEYGATPQSSRRTA